MFSMLIKKFRHDRALSQEDLVQMLLNFTGKGSMDVTTISRWERGVNTPSVQNQLYILRKLNIEFPLSSITQHQSPQKVVNLLKSRFSRFSALSDKPYRVEQPRFTYTETDQLADFLRDDELIKFNQKMFSNDFDINLLDTYGVKLMFDEVRVYRYYQGNNLVGHWAYGIINTRDIISLLEKLYKVDFSGAFSPEVDGKVLISFSGYASDLAIYLFSTKLSIKSMLKNNNIDWFVGHSFINEDWQINKNLGAKIIYRGDSVESGGIKVGKSRFKHLIYSSFVPTLLASPVSILGEYDLDKEYAEIVQSFD